MIKHQIKQLIESNLPEDGLIQTGLAGIQLFRVTEPVPCIPAIYEPTVVAILNGSKEAITEGQRYIYDSEHYLCCSVSMPVQAGTPEASPTNPLLGIMIALDTRLMAEISFTMSNATGNISKASGSIAQGGIALARWDDRFATALLRVLELGSDPMGLAVLGEGRIRELYFAILNGEAGDSVKQAFGASNEIAKIVENLSTRLDQSISIDELAQQAGMSRAVLHRKFKQVTSMSPIQFVKSMRLNKAAMSIVDGTPVSRAAQEVGYVSTSQFSREFKRLYGKSPKQWANTSKPAGGLF